MVFVIWCQYPGRTDVVDKGQEKAHLSACKAESLYVLIGTYVPLTISVYKSAMFSGSGWEMLKVILPTTQKLLLQYLVDSFLQRLPRYTQHVGRTSW